MFLDTFLVRSSRVGVLLAGLLVVQGLNAQGRIVMQGADSKGNPSGPTCSLLLPERYSDEVIVRTLGCPNGAYHITFEGVGNSGLFQFSQGESCGVVDGSNFFGLLTWATLQTTADSVTSERFSAEDLFSTFDPMNRNIIAPGLRLISKDAVPDVRRGEPFQCVRYIRL